MHFELSRDKWIYLVRCSVQRRENRRRRSVLARFGYLIQRDIRHIRLIWAPQTICRVFNFPHTFLRALARRPILHAINYFAFKNSFSFLVLLLTHRTSTLTNSTSQLDRMCYSTSFDALSRAISVTFSARDSSARSMRVDDCRTLWEMYLNIRQQTTSWGTEWEKRN